ncbi:MAG: DNA primase [Desulfuromonadales bacterium]|nr:DNA primase [Desulfuromonadales bacterium]
MIPEDKVAEVKERAGIVEVISDYVALKKSGVNFLGLCPFHGEKTPSFTVNPAKGIFHCFGCSSGGNVITFIMKIEGVSFPEAVKLLAKRVGVIIEDRPLTLRDKKRIDEKEQQLKIVELAAKYYSHILIEDKAGEAGRSYILKRGVKNELVLPYRLGFATDSWDGLVSFLVKNSVSIEQAEKLGIVRRRSNGSGYYDLFRNRLIFTIANVHGKPIGFGGRALDDSLPKYINSPESPVYSKSDVLFGIDLAKQAMREKGYAIVVEGYFDHLALYQAGVKNVVATCGTALTNGHLQLLKRYADKLYFLFDGDSAGKKATFRGMELVLPEHLPAFVIELPEGEDPDSFMSNHSIEEFNDAVKRAKPVLDYFLHDLIANGETGTVAGKTSVVDQFLLMLKKIPDPVERDLYLKELSRLFSVDLRTLLSRMGGNSREGRSIEGSAKIKGAGAGESLLVLLGEYPELLKNAKDLNIELLLPSELVPALIDLVSMIESGKKEIDWGSVMEKIVDSPLKETLASLLLDDKKFKDVDPEKALNDYYRALERKAVKNRDAKELRQELATLDSDSSRYWEIMEILNTLRNRKSLLH